MLFDMYPPSVGPVIASFGHGDVLRRFHGGLDLRARATPQDIDNSLLPLERGIFAIFLIYTVVYFLFLIICTGIIVRPNPASRRLPYSVLAVSLLFRVISEVLSTSYTGLGLFDSSALLNTDKNIALTTTPSFFLFWSLALLFASVVLFLRARSLDDRLWSQSRRYLLICGLNFLIFLLMVVLSTASNGLYTEYLHKIYRGDDPSTLNCTLDNERNLNYAANAFLGLSAVDVVALTALLRRQTRVSGLNDQVAKYLQQIVTPIYCLNVACIIAFVIIWAPSVSARWTHTARDVEVVSLITNVLELTILAVLYGALLFMACKDWTVEKTLDGTLFKMDLSRGLFAHRVKTDIDHHEEKNLHEASEA